MSPISDTVTPWQDCCRARNENGPEALIGNGGYLPESGAPYILWLARIAKPNRLRLWESGKYPSRELTPHLPHSVVPSLRANPSSLSWSGAFSNPGKIPARPHRKTANLRLELSVFQRVYSSKCWGASEMNPSRINVLPFQPSAASRRKLP